MNKKSMRIMLVDDNPGDNFYHEREIKKNNSENIVIIKTSGTQALEYLKSMGAKGLRLDLIFLDINMPGMNGWEFLEEYNRLEKKLHGQTIIVMLTTSENPDDIARAKTLSFVSDYITKPLTEALLKNIIEKHFKSVKIGGVN